MSEAISTEAAVSSEAAVSPEAAGAWSPTLSPDGRHAAYVSDRDGSPAVWVQPVGGERALRLSTGPHPVVAVQWSSGQCPSGQCPSGQCPSQQCSDGSWLACQIAPGGGPRHEVWLVRPDGSELRQVAGFGADSADNMRWLPGRPLLAVTESLRDALLIDAVDGGRRVVARGDLVALLDLSGFDASGFDASGFDASGFDASGFDVAGRFALLRYGPRGARRIVRRDTVTGTEEVLTSGEQAVFGPGGTTVYARSEDGEFPALVRIDMAGGDTAPIDTALTDTAPTDTAPTDTAPTDTAPTGTAGVVTVVAAPSSELESFALTADGRRVAALWNERGGLSRMTVHDVTVGSGAGAEGWEVPLPGAVVSGPTWSFDGSTLAFTAEGPGQPHGVWSCAEGTVQAISAEPAEPDAVSPTLETVTAHDGLTLTGWLFRPRTPGPHPAVIWLHGGPEAQERPGHGPLFQSLVRAGIAVFAPNVRGSSGFGRSFVEADNGPLRYSAIADVRSCAEHLVSAGYALPGRIGCMGRSYGGYLTLAALTTWPDLFAVGIDVCGMSNFATFYQHTEPWIAAAAVGKYGDPAVDAELLRDLSPITRIDRLRAPLLVVHGRNDTNVPLIEAEQVVAALTERGVPHRYLVFDDEGHELVHRASRAAFLEATLDWLCRYLL